MLKTGGILAMVEALTISISKTKVIINAATALRQPGSSLKPITYAVAFEKGYTPATLLMDVKRIFMRETLVRLITKPVNYDGKYRGPVQLRFCLGNSLIFGRKNCLLWWA